MEFVFSGLTADDLRDRSSSGVFIDVEADIKVLDGDHEIYSEGLFPVVELAVALRKWRLFPGRDRLDFEFHSLSLDGRWAVRIMSVDAGWRVVNDEECGGSQTIVSSLVAGVEIDCAIDNFVDKLRKSCVDLLGLWIEEFFV